MPLGHWLGAGASFPCEFVWETATVNVEEREPPWLLSSPRGDLGCLLEELWTAVSLASSGMLPEPPHHSGPVRELWG